MSPTLPESQSHRAGQVCTNPGCNALRPSIIPAGRDIRGARQGHSLGSFRNPEPAHHRRPRQKSLQRAADMREFREADQLARSIEGDQIIDPRERRHIRNGVSIPEDPGSIRETPVKHSEQALRFGNVAVARASLDRFIASGRILGNERSGLVGEIHENRSGFE